MNHTKKYTGPRAFKIPTLYLPLLCFFFSLSAQAQTFDARDVMQRVSDQETPDNQIVDMKMLLVNKRGDERKRDVLWSVQNDDKDNRSSLIRFIRPADVKGTGFLSIEKTIRDDDQWLYMPALRKVRRISSSDEQDNFMGSDFTYEDLKAEKLEKFNYKPLEEKESQGETVFVIEATPKQEFKNDTGYQKRVMYVRKRSLTFQKIEYYDKKGELEKILTGSGVKKYEKENTWRLSTLEMKNLSTGHKTVIHFSNYRIDVNENIGHLFTKRHLRKGIF